MPKNASPPLCKKCDKAMKWLPAKTGGRKYRCLDCDGATPVAASFPLTETFEKNRTWRERSRC
jgi:hypothetical protein